MAQSVLDVLRALAPQSLEVPVDFDALHGRAESGDLFGLTSRPPVPNTPDVGRVADLPRRRQVDLTYTEGPGGERVLADPTAQALVDVMNERLRRPDWQREDCRCAEIAPERVSARRPKPCITSLKAAQAWALYEAPLVGGLIGLLAVGSGKSALGFLSPLVMPNCKLAVGLVPSNLVEQFVKEYLLWREHWRVPALVYGKQQGFYYRDGAPRSTLHLVPYSILSRPDSTALLKSLKPDFVFADEMDKLANKQSARGGRFTRLFAEAPDTRFLGWTGTAWDKSIMECQHLCAYALRGGSPLPLSAHVAQYWALAIDPGERPAQPGALRKFCAPGETLREGFHRRLVETPGVVATREGAVDVPHCIVERPVAEVPETILALLQMVRSGERPDHEELVDPMEVARVACEVAMGFYYRWVFPREERGPDGKLTEAARDRIDLWFERRKAWRKELRDKLRRREEHLDSEKLCEEAAARYYAGHPDALAALGDGRCPALESLAAAPRYEGELPTWDAATYLAWKRVEDSVYHETEAVWVDDYLARDAAEWALSRRGICWYKHDAFGQRVAELSGLPLHAGGPGAEQRILAERGDRSIVASMQSHGRGRDGLQYLFSEQLVPAWPSSGRMTEQLLARIHRVGQSAPRVVSETYRHVEELRQAFDQACARGRFAHSTWGASQKVLQAECEWRSDDDDEW
jgi:hypothetical protein